MTLSLWCSYYEVRVFISHNPHPEARTIHPVIILCHSTTHGLPVFTVQHTVFTVFHSWSKLCACCFRASDLFYSRWLVSHWRLNQARLSCPWASIGARVLFPQCFEANMRMRNCMCKGWLVVIGMAESSLKIYCCPLLLERRT